MALYERIAIADIQAAADIFRPTCDRLGGARRLRQPGGLAEARQRHRRHHRRGAAAVARGRSAEPDDQGAGHQGRRAGDPPADRRGDQRQRHPAVRRRRLPGRRRGAHGRPGGRSRRRAATSPKVHGVASFFVSRIDTKIDKRDRRAAEGRTRRRRGRCGCSRLRGKIAIANAKRAYQRYLELIADAALEGAGRRPAPRRSGCCGPPPASRTRPIPDTLYVDEPDRARHGQHHAAEDHGRVPRPRPRQRRA